MLTTSLILATLCCIYVQAQNPLSSVVEWKQLDFQFPSEIERQRAIKAGEFIPENNMPLDVDVHYSQVTGRRRIFVTIPRFYEGVPFSLGTVSSFKSEQGPLIQPYPDYAWHKESANCDGITSVFRVMIDPCQRLWVLDTGKISGNWVCNPQLLAFDLNTDLLLVRHKIPEKFVQNETIMVTPVVDVLGDCSNTKVYMADITGYAMIVYDLLQNRSWRIKNELFSYDPRFTRFTISGESFDFTDGITGMALRKIGPFQYPGNRNLYFHSLASDTENSVPLEILNDEFTFSANESAHSQYFQTIGKRGAQSAAEAMDSNGNLFFGMVNPTSIACWDSDVPYNEKNIITIAKDPVTLQFTSGVKVVPGLFNQEELWVITNRLQKFIKNSYNWNDVNFRIQVGSISSILGGIKCGNNPVPVTDRFAPIRTNELPVSLSPGIRYPAPPLGLRYPQPISGLRYGQPISGERFGIPLTDTRYLRPQGISYAQPFPGLGRYGVSPRYNYLQYF